MQFKKIISSKAWQLIATTCLPLLMYISISHGNNLIAAILLFLQALIMALMIVNK